MSLVRTFTHLANQPRAPEALHTLKCIADLVHPIMKRHGWILPMFAEFFPDDERLLGLNVDSGDKILVRLRPARNPGTFYPTEQLVRVMLHELTHNVHGPHDERFYEFLNKLEDEYDSLVINGWQGTGFHAPGKRLGGSDDSWWSSRRDGEFDTDGKRKALAAAEARRRAETFSSRRRLGGPQASPWSGRTRQELAAEAAERRRLDEWLCAASHPFADREAARAATDSIADTVVDADLAEALQLSSALAESSVTTPTTRVANEGLSTLRRQPSSEEFTVESPRSSAQDKGYSQHSPSQRERKCSVCTYLNPTSPAGPNCAMCNSPLLQKPVQIRSKRWACAVCTLQNSIESLKCKACEFPKKREDWAPKRLTSPNQSGSNLEQVRDGAWTCELCTLVNVSASRVCSLCDGPRPLMPPASSGPSTHRQSLASRNSPRGKVNATTLTAPRPWDCRSCGRRGIAHDFWMCGDCGWIKTDSAVTE